VLLHIWYVAITNEIVANNNSVDKNNYFWNICKIYNVLGLLSQVKDSFNINASVDYFKWIIFMKIVYILI
jgi:hypothetical protein